MNIKQSPAGKIVKELTGYQAFVPNPLPPQIDWDTPLINSLSKADHLLGMLSREGARLPNPHLLIRPFIAREAVLSSKIEGTQATLGEVLANEVGAPIASNAHDLQEIHNYIVALDYALKRLADLPLSVRLILEIHKELMQGVRGSHATPGAFRRTQNWIGPPGCTLMTAKYIPPAPHEMMDCLSQFEKFLHDKTLPPLVHIALCHYQFEAIHPFLDGNGRIGRLLITMLLIERKLLPSPLLYLSAFFEATRDEYYRHLYRVSSEGSWNDWLIYFFNGVSLQSADALSRTERINLLISGWQNQIKRGGLAQDVLTYLAVNPFLTITKVAEHFNIAFTTARRIVSQLEEHGIIAQITTSKRDRVYCATEIFAILDEPTRISENYNTASS